MTIVSNKIWRGWVMTSLICLLMSACLWAQAGNAGQPENPKAGAAPQGATKPHDENFVIGADDVLAISVWKEPDISRSIPVRSDGKISLPLIGEVQASGQTPKQLEQEIARKLQSYISEPDVTVIVQQIKSQKFN